MWDAFHYALELEADERTRYLEELEDPELRREVAGLLAMHHDSETLLDAQPAFDAWSEEDEAALLGRRVGPYRVLEEIGRGGMGTVYLAKRSDEQYEQQVAMKVVRRGMDTEEILARFRQERQILANLEHPNIARLLDAGTTEDSLPFFVMEHIRGEPIDRYCAQLALPLDQRLELFTAVCTAVSTAHQNLVIHRDLKPSNILVTSDGTVKLLDFGIAKLVDPDSQGLTTVLLAGRRMTPEFASPEQLRGLPVTTASDVYALGVLLYRLLAGEPPYRLEGEAIGEVTRLVCEVEPELPSVVARRLESTGGDGTSPVVRWREIRGDLDNIVTRALEKDPQQRYASVDQLTEDLRRHRVGLPILARSGGVAYRAAKFVHRNRRWLAAAAVLVVVGIGFAVSMVIQGRRTAEALLLAEEESRRGEQVLNLLVDQFRIADPNVSMGDSVTAREILERGAERIRGELQDQPEVQAELLQAVGQVHNNLGLYQQAADLIGEALVIHRQAADDGPAVADSLEQLAAARHGLGDYDGAVTLHREALEQRQRQLGNDHPKVADCLYGLATSLQEQNEFERAEEYHRQALGIRRRHLGEDHELVAQSLRNLGVVLWKRGEASRAEPMLRQALELSRASLGEEHPEIGRMLDALAAVVQQRGDYEAAEQLYHESLVLYRKLYGEDHPDTAATMSNFCALAHEKGDVEAAEFLCRDALEMQRRLLGDEHPRLTTTLNNLALILHQKGEHDEAERLYRETLALNRKQHGEEHWKIAGNLNNLGLLLFDRGDLEAAETIFHEALAMYRKVLGTDHPWAGFSLNNLARLLHDRGDYRAAEDLYLEAVELRRAALPPDHPQIASSTSWLGKLYVDLGQPERGEPLLRESLEIRRAALAETDWRTAETKSLLGECLAALGRYQEAEPLLTGSYPVLLKNRGNHDRRARQAVVRVVSLYQRWGRDDQARRYREVLAGLDP